MASVQLLAELDRWLASLFSKRIVHELYAALTGADLSGTQLYDIRERPEHIKRRLVEAFRSGELVALPISALRLPRMSGGAGLGHAASPPPVVPLLPDKPEKTPGPPVPRPAPQKAQAWVAIELVGEDGKPIPGARYRLLLPDGSIREGRLDSRGTVHVDGIVPGQCKVSFPDLDAEAWAPA
jgi:hypothetical protein